MLRKLVDGQGARLTFSAVLPPKTDILEFRKLARVWGHNVSHASSGQ